MKCKKLKDTANVWLNHSRSNCPSRINDIAAIARVLYHYFLLLYSNSKGYFRPPEINPAARKRSRSDTAGTVGFSRVESPIPKFPVCCFGPLPADLSFGFGLAVGLPFLPFAKVRFIRRAGKAIRAHGGMDAALPALPIKRLLVATGSKERMCRYSLSGRPRHRPPFPCGWGSGTDGNCNAAIHLIIYLFIIHSGLIEIFCIPDSPEHRYCDNHKVLNYRIYTCSNTERMPCILVSRSSTSRYFKAFYR